MRPESLNAVWLVVMLLCFGLLWLTYRVGRLMTEIADLQDQFEQDQVSRCSWHEHHDEFGVGQW